MGPVDEGMIQYYVKRAKISDEFIVGGGPLVISCVIQIGRRLADSPLTREPLLLFVAHSLAGFPQTFYLWR